MKNKKGFTLVELLVTIALMLTILGIAIVSFINVSNNKKEEAWNEVKAQVETAAEEYITANEYYFEGLEDGSEAKISVGRLVYDDYINKVTDPRSGKSLGNCTVVNVKKEGNEIVATLVETTIDKQENDDASCNSDLSIKVVEPGAPEGEISYRKDKNSNEDTSPSINNWFNINNTGDGGNLYLFVKADTNGNGPIASALYDDKELTKKEGDYFYYSESIDDGIHKNAKITLTNASGKKWVAYITIQKDTVMPTGGIVINPKDTWNSVNVTLSLNANDITSGIADFSINSNNYFDGSSGAKEWNSNADYTINHKYDGSIITLNGVITDVAGNKNNGINSNSYTLYKSCESNNVVENGSWSNSGSCTTKCGGYGQRQVINTKDKNSGDSCGQKEQYAYCGGEKKGTSSTSCNAGRCSTGNYVTTTKYVSTIDNTVCRTETTTGAACGGTSVGSEAKAYKWVYDSKKCATGSKLTLTSADGSKKEEFTGPYKKYAFTEIVCSCNVSNIDGKSCGYTGTYNDITKTYHRYENGYYSYIIYKNNNNGKNICNSKSHSKANTYIQSICMNGNGTFPLEYHGWYWYKDDGSSGADKTKGFQSGWYVNGSKKQRYSLDLTVAQICEKACDSKY